MPCDTHGPFPFGVIRDLLGLTRGLYRAEIVGAADASRLTGLEHVGKAYRKALDLARRSGQGTLGRRAAWTSAETATTELKELAPRLAPIVKASAATLERRGWKANP